MWNSTFTYRNQLYVIDHTGQVRVFNVHIQSELLCSACLSWAQVLAFVGFSVRDREKKGGGSKGGPAALAGTREYEQSDRNR